MDGISMHGWSEYVEEGRRYLKTALAGRKRAAVFNNELLGNLIDTLTDDNVYTFNFEGNSQVLDHFFVGDAVDAELDIVHVNVDYPRVSSAVGSDHEPLVALIDLG